MTPDSTLAEAREWLRERVDHGEKCPCCTQLAKVYRRTIHATMARELIAFYRHAGREWGYLPDSGIQRGGDMVKCRYWGLIVEDDGERADGSSRNGWWRVTALGELWLRNEQPVPKYARIYDGRLLGLVGAPVTIIDALGRKFDYADLMAGV